MAVPAIPLPGGPRLPGSVEWTPRLTGGILLLATAVELVGAVILSVVTGMALAAVVPPVLIFMGVGWTLVGMAVSGSGRLAPPPTTLGGYGGGTGQASLSSEFYISRAGAERVARENAERLERGSAFMVPAVLYGVALFVIGVLLSL